MGTPTPPPLVPGDYCNVCAATYWPGGTTPKFIHVTFSDIDDCEVEERPPIDGTYVLTQTANPCHWEYKGDNWEIFVDIDPLATVDASYVDHVAQWFCFEAFFEGCESELDNGIVDCAGATLGKNGKVEIVWS